MGSCRIFKKTRLFGLIWNISAPRISRIFWGPSKYFSSTKHRALCFHYLSSVGATSDTATGSTVTRIINAWGLPPKLNSPEHSCPRLSLAPQRLHPLAFRNWRIKDILWTVADRSTFRGRYYKKWCWLFQKARQFFPCFQVRSKGCEHIANTLKHIYSPQRSGNLCVRM